MPSHKQSKTGNSAAGAAGHRCCHTERQCPAQDEGAARLLHPPPGTRAAAHVTPSPPGGTDMIPGMPCIRIVLLNSMCLFSQRN